MNPNPRVEPTDDSIRACIRRGGAPINPRIPAALARLSEPDRTREGARVENYLERDIGGRSFVEEEQAAVALERLAGDTFPLAWSTAMPPGWILRCDVRMGHPER